LKEKKCMKSRTSYDIGNEAGNTNTTSNGKDILSRKHHGNRRKFSLMMVTCWRITKSATNSKNTKHKARTLLSYRHAPTTSWTHSSSVTLFHTRQHDHGNNWRIANLQEKACTLPSPIDSRWTPHIPHGLMESTWSPPNIACFNNYGMESRWSPDGIQQKSVCNTHATRFHWANCDRLGLIRLGLGIRIRD
jgi:hypothetical protein